MQQLIEDAWENGDFSSDSVRRAVSDTLDGLENGKIRVVYRGKGNLWSVNTWVKKAILISFRIHKSKIMNCENKDFPWFDKVLPKFQNWQESDFGNAKIRAVPGAFARRGAYIAQNVVLMPSFINIGAYIDAGTMVDTWSTIGSCARIGKNCHISGGVGIAGVLEPIQSNPVIIEDNCFIGARSEIAEGSIVREGSVLAMGVYISASTKIIDRESGKIHYGEVPPYSVVVSGSLASSNGISLYCAVIVKKVDDKTRMKTSINDLLREHN